MLQSTPQLRNDLRITPLFDGDDDVYVVEDPLRNTFFKIGRREYCFLCHLDGGGNIEEFLNSTDDADVEERVTREEVTVILQWLASRQLLQKQNPETLQMIEDAEMESRHNSWLSRLNLITFRVPLFNPDPLLSRLLPWVGWLAGPLFLVIWLLSALVAFSLLLSNWDRFTGQAGGLFSPHNLVILSLIWIALKLLHELSHALACYRHGGPVYEMGLLFILFVPLTYVNASSSWTFPSKWQRIHVAVAGMYMELFVAWIALIYWAIHSDSPTALLAYNIVLVAGLNSLLFNANPLMRFDGYYVLSDLVGIPNLYSRALGVVRRSTKRWWLGVEGENKEEKASGFIRLYGLALYLWRIVVLISLGYLASQMFSGWGIILTFVAVVGWVYQPLVAFVARLPGYREQNPQLISHFIPRLLLVGLISGIGFWGIGWKKNISVPAVVLFEEPYTVRAGTSGFIAEVFVKEGGQVQAGQQLVLLDNEKLKSNRQDLTLLLSILELQLRQAHAREDYAQMQILEQQKIVLNGQTANLDDDIRNLLHRSPGNGMVVGRHLENLPGIWVDKGEELFQVVNSNDKHIVASVNQDDIGSFRGRKGEKILIDMDADGYGRFYGRIDKVAPSASTELIHFSLSAPFGGPFDVRVKTGNDGYELFTPRFSLFITVPESVRSDLRDGLQATIQTKGVSRSPGSILWQGLKLWFFARQGTGSP